MWVSVHSLSLGVSSKNKSNISPVCAPDYVHHDGSFYKHVSTATKGDAAQAACEADGANLVTIDSATENAYIQILYG